MFDDPRLRRLLRAIAAHPLRRVGAAAGDGLASVALVVRPEPHDLELLLIKRAPRAGDPWSGHMALPGGRTERRDADRLATAVRETLEEVGIDLRDSALHLGPLDEVQPLGAGVPRLAIAPFAFAVAAATPAVPNQEVEAAFWVPLGRLAHPESRAEHLHRLEDGSDLRFPALRFEGEVIWGLTFRIVSQFLAIAGVSSEAGG